MVQSVKMIKRGGPDSELNGWDGEEGDTEWRAKSVRLKIGLRLPFARGTQQLSCCLRKAVSTVRKLFSPLVTLPS
jgi:hypothetical protein